MRHYLKVVSGIEDVNAEGPSALNRYRHEWGLHEKPALIMWLLKT
uniref:Uncharacterized protein n=1 Tax=Pseudomonas syringae pv. actinidiae TaxID=103796 RepID=A0A2P0QG28_PSESF|nr:hypothetical protein [Pseudomonas syringae pv. actinidiae]